MARDLRKTVAALERKAADPACTPAEADALRAKATELRAKLPAEPDRVRVVVAGGVLTFVGQGENVGRTSTGTNGQWVKWNGRFD